MYQIPLMYSVRIIKTIVLNESFDKSKNRALKYF